MGLFEQAFRETEAEPLNGILLEIQQILDRVRNPRDSMTEAEALVAITRLAGQKAEDGEIYQKPWG